MSFVKRIALFVVLLTAGCGDITDDLVPSGDDQRPPVVAGSLGPDVGQVSPDFTLSDTLANPVTLSSELATADAVVLYFNMWCPICDSHMSHIRTDVRPDFPSVDFVMVDYVTGSVSNARSAQVSNGYTDFVVLADTAQSVLDLYHATMGTTVVIDSTGVVRMNEDYKDGTRLRTVLEALP
jgi:peroxiredoxin